MEGGGRGGRNAAADVAGAPTSSVGVAAGVERLLQDPVGQV